ncbi:MAG: D-alanyl-D-alanine carboxypeptidase, partial [Clostridia bacterium]|nr:D-alanyl-D-alanine carboxypeptidase [Clostridia bacterium]
ASTTKIMTYIVTVEHVQDLKGTKVTVDKDILDQLQGTGSSLSGLEYFVGKSLSIYDLLNCLMIKSGNDAALLLANYIGDGSVQSFVDMMNQKARDLNCNNTHFMNPHGLHDENHYTTAEDLAIITQYAMTLPEFNEITSTVSTYLSADTEKEYPLITTNYLIDEKRGGDYYYEYAKGIKTGTTDEAGYCLVSSASNGGYTYLCIALGAPSVNDDLTPVDDNGAMLDSAAMFKWAFDNLALKSVVDEQTPVCEVPIELAWNQDTVQLVPQGQYSTILPNDIERSSIDIVTEIPDKIIAPVIEGSVIGTATIKYANQDLTTVNLIAAETVERSKILFFLDSAKKILKSQWMILSIVIVIVLIVLYVIITMIYNHKKNKNKKMKSKKRSVGKK